MLSAKSRPFRSCLLLSGLLITLSGCFHSSRTPVITPMLPTGAVEVTTPTLPDTPPEEVEHLTLVVTEETILQLNDYPNLKSADLTGSQCYSAIARYRKFSPDVEVTYTVSLGNTAVDAYAEEVSLTEGEYDYDTLLENLQYLEKLRSLSLKHISISPQQLEALRQAYPDLELTYSVTLLGNEYDSDSTEIDLSFLTPDTVAEAARILPMLPKLQYVELMDGSSPLSMEDVKMLVDAAPQANVHYTFSLFGKTISTTDERVEYVNAKIGNEGEAAIRQALDIMTGCTYLKLENCGLDNKVLAGIRDDYPDTKIVWKVKFGKYSAMTDTDTIRAVYNVFDDTCYNLRYCTDVKYMDIGHNESLTDLSFIGFMPKLEILIASGCNVTDLSGFENCKNLEFLELAYCLNLQDLTPLAGCESLKQLNISYTKVTNLAPLDGLPLERLMSIHTWVKDGEQKIFQEIHPDCWTVFYYGNQPYGKGWRYDDNGMTYSEMYKKVREVFGYDDMPMPKIEPKK